MANSYNPKKPKKPEERLDPTAPRLILHWRRFGSLFWKNNPRVYFATNALVLVAAVIQCILKILMEGAIREMKADKRCRIFPRCIMLAFKSHPGLSSFAPEVLIPSAGVLPNVPGSFYLPRWPHLLPLDNHDKDMLSKDDLEMITKVDL